VESDRQFQNNALDFANFALEDCWQHYVDGPRWSATVRPQGKDRWFPSGVVREHECGDFVFIEIIVFTLELYPPRPLEKRNGLFQERERKEIDAIEAVQRDLLDMGHQVTCAFFNIVTGIQTRSFP